MAYNENLADRVREIIGLTHQNVEEKRMFGGICLMVIDKMCVGVQKDHLMVRVNPDIFETLMEQEGCVPMDFTGKIMKGFIFVESSVLTRKKKLEYWVELALDYNKIAKASKKKKK